MHSKDRDAINQPFSFGPFRLFPEERRLEKNAQPVKISERTFDVLHILLCNAGKTVSGQELDALVWPNTLVGKGSLRNQILALRKLIDDDASETSFIVNVPGRGYRFQEASSRDKPIAPPKFTASVDSPRVIGREETVRGITQKLLDRRFVTIVGVGGIGKTTVAAEIFNALRGPFGEAARFIDLGILRDGALLPSFLASAFSPTVRSDDPIAGLVSFLASKRALIVLDCCEHLLDDLAPIVERLLRETADAFVLATSREPLRARGEYVEQLAALAFPSSGDGIGASEALQFSAVKLFTERAAADLASFELDDESAPVAVEICRKLDGIALAIELAAACVPVHGIREIATLLGDRFALLTRGRRTADPRHQTLRATLDWSYDLLSDLERSVLCRLSIFVGHWSLNAGLQVAASIDLAEARVMQALGKLVSKSLVSVDRARTYAPYRLLDTTRSYALSKLEAQGDLDEIARQHAIYICRWLEGFNDDFPDPSDTNRRAAMENVLGNVRSALEWCFSATGSTVLGASLIAGSGQFFLELSFLAECGRWSEAALACMDASVMGAPREMEIQELRALSLLYTTGNNQTVGDVLERALALAEALGDHHRRLRLLGNLHIHHGRMADFRRSLEVAEQSETLAQVMNDEGAVHLSGWLLGVTHYHLGNQSLVLRYCGSALFADDTTCHLEMARVGVSHRMRALTAFARSLWLSGRPDEAARVVQIGIEDAERLAHPGTLSVALIWSVPVYVWIGNFEKAEEVGRKVSKLVDEHSLLSFRALALGMEGELLLKRGQAISGVKKLKDCLKAVGREVPRLVASTFAYKLAEGLLLLDRPREALQEIESAIEQAQSTSELVNLSEMMRVKANILKSMRRPHEAEDQLLSAMDLARKQAALSWELRAGMDLAQHWGERGRVEDAVKLLKGVYNRFDEGLGTQDLIRARKVLDRLVSEEAPD